jgi:hypothetical protein
MTAKMSFHIEAVDGITATTNAAVAAAACCWIN